MPNRRGRPSGPVMAAVRGGHEESLALAVAGVEPAAFVGPRRESRGMLSRLGQAVGFGGDAGADADELWAPEIPSWTTGERSASGYTLVEGDVALIEVEGPTMPVGFRSWWSGAYYPGYADYVAALEAAEADERVDAKVIVYDTPGGLVEGLFDTAKAFRRLSGAGGGKPTVGFARFACSAGQTLFAQSDLCMAANGANVGSVGVRLVFVTMVDWLKQIGDQYHVAKSGRLKDMGAMWREPTEEEMGLFQDEVNYLADQLYTEVAAGRSVDREAIAKPRGWEAKVFTAGDPEPPASINAQADGVELVDAIGDLRAAVYAAKALAGAS